MKIEDARIGMPVEVMMKGRISKIDEDCSGLVTVKAPKGSRWIMATVDNVESIPEHELNPRPEDVHPTT